MKRIATILSIVCLASFLATQSTHADDLYWDQNGATAGTGGTGTWTTANTWRSGSNVGVLQTWADSNNAHFEGTAGTVTIAGGTTVAPVTSFFEVTGYTLTPSNTSQTALAGSISLSASVNLNLLGAATTADRIFSIGSVSGGAGSSLTLQGAQTTPGNNARILLEQAGESISVPITISGAGSTFAGFVAINTGTGITGTITNNSSFTTLLGSAGGSDLTLSSTAVISGTAGVRIAVANSTGNSGTVTLNAANLYSGGTTLDSGFFVLGNNAALGTGTLTLSNSATSVLQAGGGSRTIANNVVWGGSGTISGSNAMTINGSFTSSGSNSRSLTVSNTGGTTLGGNVFLSEDNTTVGRTLRINGSTAATINGVIANNNSGNTLAASLLYSGTSTLTLNNTNTYSGGTSLTVSGGTIVANADGALGTGNVSLTATSVTLTLQNGATNNYISNNASITIVTGAVANLNFTLTSDLVGGITLGGVMQTNPGTYGAVGSGATFQSAFFTGTGTLTLVPEPATYMLLGVGLLVCAQRLRRKRA